MNASSKDTAFAAQSSGIVLPKTSIYALNANNAILVLQPGATSFTRLGRVTTLLARRRLFSTQLITTSTRS
jgi:hypothetical protein